MEAQVSIACALTMHSGRLKRHTHQREERQKSRRWGVSAAPAAEGTAGAEVESCTPRQEKPPPPHSYRLSVARLGPNCPWVLGGSSSFSPVQVRCLQTQMQCRRAGRTQFWGWLGWSEAAETTLMCSVLPSLLSRERGDSWKGSR